MNLHPLRYWAAQALRGIRSGWTIQLAAMGSIGVGLLLVGMVVLGAINLDRLVGTVGNGLHVTAYLRPSVTASDASVKKLGRTLEKNSMVSSVRRVSRAEAYKRLTDSLGDRPGLLAGVSPEFLPASLELTLRRSEADRVRPLLALLSASPMVEEVDYLGDWVNRLSSIMAMARGVGIAIAIIVCLACLYIIGSTIRLGVFARRNEISILRLVGATDRYVRAPFLLEGAVQGAVGALLASGLLYILYRITAPPLEGLLTDALSHTQLGFLSAPQLLLGIGCGTLLGLVGSRVAIARYMDM